LDRQAGGGTSDWQALTDAAVALRRRLHRHPELAWEETTTAQLVRDELDQAGIAWRACAGTGTVATLAPHAPGRHVALRTDLDAMPIDEATGVDWSSETPGVMHACGHDGHIATLFAAAWWCKRHEDLLPGPVTLLFQPAEEGGHGAKGMLDDGGLDGVDVVYGWHNWPALPVGRAVCPDGPVMSANGTFEIEVLGVGGHASQPEVTRDPVLAAPRRGGICLWPHGAFRRRRGSGRGGAVTVQPRRGQHHLPGADHRQGISHRASESAATGEHGPGRGRSLVDRTGTA
jgi:hippurate hydrolase